MIKTIFSIILVLIFVSITGCANLSKGTKISGPRLSIEEVISLAREKRKTDIEGSKTEWIFMVLYRHKDSEWFVHYESDEGAFGERHSVIIVKDLTKESEYLPLP